MPEGAVYVGRPSVWGNPYTIRDVAAMFPHTPLEERAATAVRLYRAELKHWGLLSDYHMVASERTVDAVGMAAAAVGAKNMADYARSALKDKNLVCWCPLDQPCHADVLLELAS